MRRTVSRFFFSEHAFENYFLLRSLLSTELAIPTELERSVVVEEWEATLSFLLKQDCLRLENDRLETGKNTKLFSLLRNLLSPYVVGVHIVCTVLAEVR